MPKKKRINIKQFLGSKAGSKEHERLSKKLLREREIRRRKKEAGRKPKPKAAVPSYRSSTPSPKKKPSPKVTALRSEVPIGFRVKGGRRVLYDKGAKEESKESFRVKGGRRVLKGAKEESKESLRAALERNRKYVEKDRKRSKTARDFYAKQAKEGSRLRAIDRQRYIDYPGMSAKQIKEAQTRKKRVDAIVAGPESAKRFGKKMPEVKRRREAREAIGPEGGWKKGVGERMERQRQARKSRRAAEEISGRGGRLERDTRQGNVGRLKKSQDRLADERKAYRGEWEGIKKGWERQDIAEGFTRKKKKASGLSPKYEAIRKQMEDPSKGPVRGGKLREARDSTPRAKKYTRSKERQEQTALQRQKQNIAKVEADSARYNSPVAQWERTTRGKAAMRAQDERRAAARLSRQESIKGGEEYHRDRRVAVQMAHPGAKYMGVSRPKLSVGPQRSSRTTSPRSQRPKVAAMARPKRPTYGQKHRATYSDEWGRRRR